MSEGPRHPALEKRGPTLLLWIGLAIAGGGVAAVVFGAVVLETPFGSFLMVGGLILICAGLVMWALGLVIRKLARAPAAVASPRPPGVANSLERPR